MKRRLIQNIAGLAGVMGFIPCCAQMGQQQAGQVGGAVGAAGGALGLTALARSQGARGSDLVAPAVLGGLGGFAVGNKVGQNTGLQGVYKTEVPSE